MLALALAFVLLAPPATAPAAAGLSLAQAEALQAKLERIQATRAGARRKAPAPVWISADELNSYFAYKLRAKLPPEVSDLRLLFERDRFKATGLVDFDVLKQKLPPLGPFNPLTLLGGRLPAEFAGRFLTQDGFGTFKLEEARLGSLPVPVTLIEQALARSTKSAERPDGVDLDAPVRLPYGIRRVRLEPGRALLEY